MNQNTVLLVQESWKNVAAIAPQAAELFYQNLGSSRNRVGKFA